MVNTVDFNEVHHVYEDGVGKREIDIAILERDEGKGQMGKSLSENFFG